MIISNDLVVSIDYTLKNEQGEIIDTSENSGPLDYIHGRNNLITGLEKELTGKEEGQSFSVTIEPSEAYGEYSDELVVEVSKDQFPSDVEIEVGMQFEAESGQGSRLVTVAEVSDKTVKIDANHPLAGQKLFFDVKIVAVREATPEELQNGLNYGGCNCGSDDCDCDSDCGSCGCGCGGCN